MLTTCLHIDLKTILHQCLRANIGEYAINAFQFWQEIRIDVLVILL